MWTILGFLFLGIIGFFWVKGILKTDEIDSLKSKLDIEKRLNDEVCKQYEQEIKDLNIEIKDLKREKRNLENEFRNLGRPRNV